MTIDTILQVISHYPAWQWLAAALAITAATCVQYGLGIAFGLIAGPLLALVSIDFVPAPVLLLTCVTATSSLISERHLVNWRQARTGIGGRIAGAIIAAMVLGMIPSEKAFMPLFGLTIAGAVLVSVSGISVPFSLPSIAAAGSVSGFTATITGVGGPPMAIVYQHQKAATARPTLQAFFAFGSALSFIILFLSGHVGVRDIVITAMLLPAFAAGFLIGPFVRPLFDRNFRKFLLALAAASAAMLIWRGLFS